MSDSDSQIDDAPRRPGRKAARREAATAEARAERQGPQPEDRPRSKVVGRPKQEFGTRISRRISCTRCGKVDHIPFVPRNKDNVLCRACAEEVVQVYEEGVQVPKEEREAFCAVCSAKFHISKKVPEDAEVLCHDCIKGNESWQGSLKHAPEERGQLKSEARPSGLRLRRRKEAASGSDD